MLDRLGTLGVVRSELLGLDPATESQHRLGPDGVAPFQQLVPQSGGSFHSLVADSGHGHAVPPTHRILDAYGYPGGVVRPMRHGTDQLTCCYGCSPRVILSLPAMPPNQLTSSIPYHVCFPLLGSTLYWLSAG